MAKPYGEQLMDLVDEYRTDGNTWPASTASMAVWMVSTGRWEQDPKKQIAACAKDLAKAMRDETHRDPSGKEVRTMAAAKKTVVDDRGNVSQAWLWCDIRDRTPSNHEHVLRAFHERFKQVKADAQSVMSDLESYNTYYKPDYCNPIQLEFEMDELFVDAELVH